jgi:hypothetical protein
MTQQLWGMPCQDNTKGGKYTNRGGGPGQGTDRVGVSPTAGTKMR